jgi:G3E family GTPase
MDNTVPVHLICGFLGSGKTTLLRRILAEQPQDEPLAILVNEFGELGVDGQFLQGFESQVLELTSGCICCSLRLDFVRALVELYDGFSPKRIIVEATGLADAADLVPAVAEAAKQRPLALGSRVTVVDAEMFENRDMFGSSYFGQIASADLLLLNKTDLVAPDAVEPMIEELGGLNPGARILPVVHCAVERGMILQPLHADGLPAPAASGQKLLSVDALLQKPDHRPGTEGDKGFTSFAFQHSGNLKKACLEDFLRGLPWEVFRVKGYARLDQGGFMVNHTFRRPELTPVNDSGPTRLAFVAWKLEPQQILDQLKACTAADG